MSKMKKLVLSLSVALTMLMAMIVGVVGNIKSDVSSPKSPSTSQSSTNSTTAGYEIKYQKPTTYYFKDGEVEMRKGGDVIDFSYEPSNNTTSSGIVSYEYIFGNPADEKLAVNLQTVLSIEGVTVSYHWSTYHIDNITQSTSKFETQPIEVGGKAYLYIILQPTNVNNEISVNQRIVWTFGKAGEIVITNSADKSTTSITTIKGVNVVEEDIPVPELEEDQTFVGWFLDEKHTIPAVFPLVDANTPLYAKVKLPGLPEDWFEYVEYQWGDNYYKVVKGEKSLAELGITDVVIPATYTKDGVTANVTYIEGDYEFAPFMGDTTITSITIPASVTSFGHAAFMGCTNLQTVTFEEGSQLTYLDDIGEEGLFENCTSLTDINLEDLENLHDFGIAIFKNCTSLESVIIPAGMNLIEYEGFAGCTSLNSVVFEDLDWWVADKGTWEETDDIIIEPEDLADPAKAAEIISTTYVEYRLSKRDTEPARSMEYEGVYDMENINHYHKLIGVGDVKSSDITIPATYNDNGMVGEAPVNAIHKDAFNGHTLTSVTFENPNDWYVTQSETNWNNKTGGTPVDVSTPSTNALHFTHNYVGYYWYQRKAPQLEYSYNSADGGYYVVTGKGEFTGTDLVIPATYNDGDNGEKPVREIADNAFRVNSDITSVTIGDNVTSIGSYAFYDCTSLTSVDFGANSALTSIGNYAFQHCTNLTSITIPEGVTSIGNFAFSICTSLTSITIPEGVTSIGIYAFSDCTSLTSVDFGANSALTSIGMDAFSICTSLTSITIPEGVTSIGSEAFQNCTSLSSISIPASVTSIGSNAFSACTSLTIMVVDSNNQIYDSRDNCNAIIESASNTLIAGCKSTIIPNTVTSIGSYAFYECSSLTSINIPSSVNSIGRNAFYRCTKLTITFGLTSGWYRTTSKTSAGSSVSASNLSNYMISTYYSSYYYNTTAGGSYTNYN